VTPFDPDTGIHMKRLGNGIRFNYKVSRAESHRGCLSLKIPGGRMLEAQFKPGRCVHGTRLLRHSVWCSGLATYQGTLSLMIADV
jgi:hypothetical protein